MSTTEALEPAAMPADVIERHIEGIAAHTLPAATYDALRAVSESDRYNRYMRELMRRLPGEAAESFFRTRKGATPRLNAQPGKEHSHVIDRRQSQSLWPRS